MPPKAAKRRPARGEKMCPLCKKTFNVRGYGKHAKACQSRQHESALASAVGETTHSREEGKSNFPLHNPESETNETKDDLNTTPPFEDTNEQSEGLDGSTEGSEGGEFTPGAIQAGTDSLDFPQP